MALDPDLLLLRDDGEEEFGKATAGRVLNGSRSGSRPPLLSSGFRSRSKVGRFRSALGCLQPVRDGVLFASGHGEASGPELGEGGPPGPLSAASPEVVQGSQGGYLSIRISGGRALGRSQLAALCRGLGQPSLACQAFARTCL